MMHCWQCKPNLEADKLPLLTRFGRRATLLVVSQAVVNHAQRTLEPITPVGSKGTLRPFLFAALARSALVVGMCACTAWACAALLNRISPGETNAHALVTALIAIVVAADVLYIRQKNARLGLFSKEWLFLNGSRWALIVITLKLASYIGRPMGDILAEAPEWRLDPARFFWDGRFALSIVVVLTVWAVGRVLGDDLSSITEGEQTMQVDHEMGARTDRPQTRRALTTHVFVIGAITALIGSLANGLLDPSAPAFPVGPNLVLYFAQGLALLGLAQLTMLRANWLWERTPIASNLVKRWTVLGLLFITLLAGVAVLLPSGLARGALPTVTQIFAFLVAVAQMLIFLVYGLFNLLLWPLTQLFRSNTVGGTPGAPIPPPIPPPANPAPAGVPVTLPPWFQLAQSLVFWTIILILLVYAARYLLRQHAGLRQALSELPLVAWLRAGWRELAALFRSMRQQRLSLRSTRVASGLISTQTEDPPEATLDVTHLPSREQLRLVYLDLLKQAARLGVARNHGQTPYEFARTLSRAAPEAQVDITELTEQFVDARYSAHAVPDERVGWARRIARKIKGVLG